MDTHSILMGAATLMTAMMNAATIRAIPIRTALMLAAITGIGLLSQPTLAQDYPNRPIRIISGSAAGGPTDLIARIIGERLSTYWKVPVLVENKPGGTGAVALDIAAKSAPDGYTLVVGFTSANVIYPLLNDKLPFNAQEDFTPIARATYGGTVLVVHPSVPVNNVKEFIAYVKSQPVPPNYGSWGNGSGGHLSGELMKTLTGIDMTHVPYRSTTALAVDMVGGHMLLGVLDASNTMAQVKAGKLRAIGITGPQRVRGMPDLPTMREQGVDFGIGIFTGILGPANMPPPIVEKLNAEIVRILNESEVREKFLTLLGDYPAPTSAAEFDKQIKDEHTVWKRVISEGKIRL
jgi:tripartite-type tricarboxylate transporter receptor subunit TctC